jgi:hypothetical protein
VRYTEAHKPTEWRQAFAYFPQKIGTQAGKPVWIWLESYEFRYTDEHKLAIQKRPLNASSDFVPTTYSTYD